MHVREQREDLAHVEHRQRVPEALVVLELPTLGRGDPGADEGLVGEHAALWTRRRPGRVHQHRLVPQPNAAPRGVHLGDGHALSGSEEREAVDEAVGRALAERDPVPEVRGRILRCLGDQADEIDVLPDQVVRRDRDHARVLQHVPELERPEPHVDRDDRHAEQGAPELQVEEVEAVGHEDADPVAGTDAEAQQASGRSAPTAASCSP